MQYRSRICPVAISPLNSLLYKWLFKTLTEIRVGEVLLYIREDIPSKELRLFNMLENLESIFVEIKLFKPNGLFINIITHQVKTISTFSIIYAVHLIDVPKQQQQQQ